MKVGNIFRKYGDRLSPEQKADIRKGMADGQEGLDKMRAFALANSDQPATVFVTFRKNGRKEMLSEDILFLPVSELSAQIRARKLSPVELTSSYVERIRKLGPRFNAYATLTADLAMEQAHAAQKEINAGKYRGPLHGIPYAAKDLLAVKGF